MFSRSAAEHISVYPRVLVLDVNPPGWAVVKSVLCEALSNVLCLGAATAQPGERLSIYTVRERHQCLLPLLDMRGNLFRLQRCLSELKTLPVEGCGALRNRTLSMAVLDSLQQNKQRMLHNSSGATLHSCLVEVTIVSTRPGRELICDLDDGLQDADLSTLRRLLVLHISSELEESGSPEPETPPGQGSHVYDIDSHVALPDVLSLEIFFKSWLLERSGEKEKCHLVFSEGASDLEVMCDVNRPLLNPGLLLGEGDGAHPRGSALTANPRVTQAFKVIRVVSLSGVCGSMFYGLPTILTPTACWELDWDQLEANQDYFHALCHCLQLGSSSAPSVLSHVLVSAADSAALLLRPIAVRELVLIMKLPPLPPTMAENALQRVQDVLRSLDTDTLYNPLQMSSNLYCHLQAALTQTQNPRRHISTTQGTAGPSRQVNFPGRKARATIAPLHFAAPGLSKRKHIENDSPSPKRRFLCDKEV
ncbi:meiosis 1 arrest protein isoform X2 [Hyla sarda]|uniref:meiosis 1 arrest protein isoform X2 n=1 Tax=Hyla sarda TaxID=327740 RepID=UPI0024C44730|nr:meiosis 1 arrest protein isoform X2 [Hyla sarda]